MKYFLDTNILVIYLRGNPTKHFIDSRFKPFEIPNVPLISVVTVGEIQAFALKNNWGEKRIANLNKFLQQVLIVDINSADIIAKYAEIDAFSQGRLKGKPLKGSSRNMGKNDIWIAASAAIANATFLTTDNDFNHLKEGYLRLEMVELLR
jgi:predicted nucleic acid-binding protein